MSRPLELWLPPLLVLMAVSGARAEPRPAPASAAPIARVDLLLALRPQGVAPTLGLAAQLFPMIGPPAPRHASVFATREARVWHALVIVWPLLTPEESQEPYRAALRLSGEQARVFDIGRPEDGTSMAKGAVLFGGAVLLAARAPAPLRFLFDRSVHLGPALLGASGLGAGIAGAF